MEQNINAQVKKAMEQMEYPFDEVAWEKMELLLNREDEEKGAVMIPASNIANNKIRSNHRKMFFTLIILLLMIIFLPFQDIISSDNGSAVNQKQDETKDHLSESKITSLPVHEKVPSGQKNPAKEIEVAENKNMVAEKITLSQKNTLVAVDDDKMRNQLTSTTKDVKLKPGTDYTISKKSTDIKGMIQKKLLNEQPENNKKNRSAGMAIEHSMKMVSHSNGSNTYEKNFKVKQTIDTYTLPVLDAQLNQNITHSSPIKQATKETDSIQKNLFKHIGVTVFAGAEINSVKMKDWGALQPLAGAGITVFSGKHLSYSGLIVFSKKTYTTNRKGYNPPNGSFLQPIDTLNVNADCNVLEIPVAIRYYLNENSKNGVFVSAGLSSYLMRREEYFFQYYEQGIYKERQRLVVKENNHFASNLNLSIGYQYSLNRKIRFFAEPYLKLPLSGVGAGTVKLTSAGIATGITFLPW